MERNIYNGQKAIIFDLESIWGAKDRANSVPNAYASGNSRQLSASREVDIPHLILGYLVSGGTEGDLSASNACQRGKNLSRLTLDKSPILLFNRRLESFNFYTQIGH